MSRHPAEGSQAPLDWDGSTEAPQETPVSETDFEERDLPTVSSRATRSGPRYMFIDQAGDRRSSNEAIRVHVMRQSHRARRQLLGLQQSANEDRQDQITILQTTVLPDSQIRSSFTSEESGLNIEAEIETSTADNLITFNPQSLVNLRLFARHYTTISSSIQRTVLELCWNNVAALSAFLSLVVLQFPGVGTNTPQIRSAELESQALVTVRSALATSPAVDHDDIVLTIALLSRLERYRSNDEVAGFHEAALQRMIQDLGGTEALAERNAALAQVLRSLELLRTA